MSPKRITAAAVRCVLRPRNQITLPGHIVAYLGLREGDTVQFTRAENGDVIVHPLRLYLLEPEPAPMSVDEELAEIASSAGPQW